ncbi:5-methyltetrahydropteroyltriglutamate--homocysteine methyltransferase [Mycobacterium tuberculosis]|nr:5-methyltetrahydropteroyltriglutamate--homocysteine methyltransferase [Mycobacterium tuberculosis]
MTKWFDTNYHYLVPEIGPSTTFTLHPGKVLAELKEALGQGIPARPVIIGPITFLLLSKAVDGAGAPIERLEELVPVYSELLSLLADGGAQWVQFDEPALVTDLSPDAPALAEAVYTALCSVSNRPAIYVATYFGDPGAALPALARTPVEAIGVDLVAGADTSVAGYPSWPARRWWPGRRRAQRLAHRPGGGVGHVGDPAGFGGYRGRLDVVLDTARAVLAGTGNRPG